MAYWRNIPKPVRNNLRICSSGLIHSSTTSHSIGKLSIPTLSKLRSTVSSSPDSNISVRQIVGDSLKLHEGSMNNGATFQVASQFNLLEMASPSNTPEEGIGKYEWDLTQGPACSIACGAGTTYRNYFLSVSGQVGQSKDMQVNCLDELEKLFGDTKNWDMKNGYLITNEQKLSKISAIIDSLSHQEYDKYLSKLKVGIMSNTEVTSNDCGNLVTQVYCSALPVAYHNIDTSKWEIFAQFILNAAYEATFAAAVLNKSSNKLYLTLVGGGAFGNNKVWILNAISRAIEIYKNHDLDISIVSFQSADADIDSMIKSLSYLK